MFLKVLKARMVKFLGLIITLVICNISSNSITDVKFRELGSNQVTSLSKGMFFGLRSLTSL
jgi:hypothetical protein